MSSRGPYRRHAAQFKRQLCQEIRSGSIGRRIAFVEAKLTDTAGRLLASATSTLLVISP